MHLEDITELDDYFMFPWEASNSLKELRDYWQDLRNQVAGRGIAPRTDIPPEIQLRILRDFKAFRRWEKELGFGDRFLGTFQDELATYSSILQEDYKLFAKWLQTKPGAKELPPPAPPLVILDEIPTGKIAVSLGSVAVIGAIGVGLYLLWPAIKQWRKK